MIIYYISKNPKVIIYYISNYLTQSPTRPEVRARVIRAGLREIAVVSLRQNMADSTTQDDAVVPAQQETIGMVSLKTFC